MDGVEEVEVDEGVAVVLGGVREGGWRWRGARGVGWRTRRREISLCAFMMYVCGAMAVAGVKVEECL